MSWRGVAVLALVVVAAPAPAVELAPARGATLEARFTPGDAIDVALIALIDGARQEVLVQAYSFTHRGIAQALLRAHRRGVAVEVVADRGQALERGGGAVAWLRSAGVPVWLDGNYAAAHNKILVVDAGAPGATVVTGSYNFTRAAETRNAENVLIVRRDPALAARYRAEFRGKRDRAERARQIR